MKPTTEFDKMKKEMNLLKVEEKWNEYVNSYNDLKNDFQIAQDSSQEHQNIADIATLSSDFSKSLDDLKAQVEEIVKKYAITDEGRLARSIKQISKHVPNPCLQNIQNYSLPKELTYEVKFFSSYLQDKPKNCSLSIFDQGERGLLNASQ